MEHHAGPRHRVGQRRLVADVGDDAGDAVGVAAFQPGEVALHAGPRQRVVDDDVVPVARQPVGEVAADEARAAGHQGRARGHATSPRSSSSSRASATRSSAC